MSYKSGRIQLLALVGIPQPSGPKLYFMKNDHTVVCRLYVCLLQLCPVPVTVAGAGETLDNNTIHLNIYQGGCQYVITSGTQCSTNRVLWRFSCITYGARHAWLAAQLTISLIREWQSSLSCCRISLTNG